MRQTVAGATIPMMLRRRLQRELPLDRDDVLAIMGALADIRADTSAIRELLEEDDGTEGRDEP